MSDTLGRPVAATRKIKTGDDRPVEISVQVGRENSGRVVYLRVKDGNQELVFVIPMRGWFRLDRDANQVP